MRCTRTAPDLSSLSERESEIVSTAILSGTNCLVSSSPGMSVRLTQLRFTARPREGGEPSPLDSRLRGNERILHYSVFADSVSQPETWPPLKPFWNKRLRCSEEPCVKLSGTT